MAERDRLSRGRTGAEEELRLLYAITRAFAEAGDFQSAFAAAVSLVCESTGWSFGEAWAPGAGGKAMELVAAWHSGGEELEKFKRASELFFFPPGRGLPGRVWSSKQPEWIEDVSAAGPDVFPRAPLAAAAGLKAAVGIPIVSEGEVLAVLGYYFTERREEDSRMVNLVAAVAAQLGPVIRQERVEEALRRSEERFRLLAEHAQDAIFRYRYADPPGWEYVSPAVTRIGGYTPEEFYADPDFASRAVHPEDREAFDRMEQERQTGPVELRWVGKDGSVVWTEQRNTFLHDRDGNLVAVEGVIRDISERKRMEEALQRAREELEGKVERQIERGNPYRLTFRELTVLHLVAAGKSDKEIAVELGISPLTVHKHVSNILTRMRASSRTDAVARALREGLLD